MKVGKNIECFSCAGGMAEGFRRAGIEFHFAFDFANDHCASYEANLKHRPVCMDVRDVLRLAREGMFGSPKEGIDLFVADPPCTPWSRAGKRQGTDDERDMLEDTCELIRLLRPRAYLIGNVPGLDDSKNWHVVQRVIGGLQKHGYCVADFAALDAANYGVPQNRIRPFWYGHLDGPCIRWPTPTHADKSTMTTLTLPGIEPLIPWVTCRQALGHLPPDELGRPVRLRKRAARVVGASNLSDGNVLLNEKHPPSEMDRPSQTIGAKQRGNGLSSLRTTRHEAPDRNHQVDKPARAITTQSRYADNGSLVTTTRRTTEDWPWDRPSTTVQADDRIAPPGHHDENWDGGLLSTEGAIVLSEKAAIILQGFPDTWKIIGRTKKIRWSQIGQAMPPGLAHAVARAVFEQRARARKSTDPLDRSLATGKLTVV